MATECRIASSLVPLHPLLCHEKKFCRNIHIHVQVPLTKFNEDISRNVTSGASMIFSPNRFHPPESNNLRLALVAVVAFGSG